MNSTYKVRIWSIKPRKNQKGKVTSYGVRWSVDGGAFYESFKVRTQAEGRHADLLSAQRRGEPFDIETGLPRSLVLPRGADMSWYEFACKYVDVKWPNAAATYRRTIAEALTVATPAMLKAGVAKPDDKAIRSVLCKWAFNPKKRRQEDKPADVVNVLRWIERNSLPLDSAMKPDNARALLNAVVTRLDGKPGARTVARQRRMILNNALNFAVERELIDVNPVKPLKWTAPKPSRAIDRRRVANPVQARTLLRAVRKVRRSGPGLYACYAAMYFAALRPEEAVNLRASNLTLPEPTWNGKAGVWENGWGDICIEGAAPHAGKAWTDTGKARDARGLKHRERGEVRHVPCPPELTRILREHLTTYGSDADGRLFRGVRGGEVPLITWNRVWQAARAAALTEEVAATPLAKRPYDLRHAAVSTWLNGGVPATLVAEWAGHSVEVLLEVYAKCLDGQDQLAMRQVQQALGHRDPSGER